MERRIPVPVEVHPNSASRPLAPVKHTDKNALTRRFNGIINTIERKKIENTDVLINEIYSVDLHQISLLIEACINGENSIVEILISRFNVAVDNLGNVVYHYFFVEGVTALWCAAANGNIEVVRMLVENGANFNFINGPISPPLRDDVFTASKINESCLMTACFNGQTNVVDYLLDKGVEINLVNRLGSTALHFVASTTNVSLAEVLLNKNPLLLKNKLCLSPVLVAAEKANYPMTICMLNALDISREEKIEAEELLGASLLISEDYNECHRGYTIIHSAQQKREQEPELKKKVVTTVKLCYNNKVEYQNLRELEMMFNNAEALHLEGLIMRERILGENNELLIFEINKRGDHFRLEQNFKSCILLWNRVLEIGIHNKREIDDLLLEIIQVFHDMLDRGPGFDLSDLKNTLLLICDELIRNKRRLPDKADETYTMISQYIDNLMSCTMLLISVTSLVFSRKIHIEDTEVESEIMDIIVKINKNDFRTTKDQTIFHLSVTCTQNMTGTGYIWYPCYDTMKLLIFCGADVNAVDNNKNTPLHCIGKYITETPFFHHDIDGSNTKNMAMELLKAGAHTDYVNAFGDCPHTGYLSDLLNLTNNVPRQLKCLSASVLRQQFPEEYYCDQIPTKLVKFTNSH